MVRDIPALVITDTGDLVKTAGIPHLRTLICALCSSDVFSEETRTLRFRTLLRVIFCIRL